MPLIISCNAIVVVVAMLFITNLIVISITLQVACSGDVAKVGCDSPNDDR